MKHAHTMAVAVALAFLLAAGSGHAFFGFGSYETVEPVDDVVTIPVADVDDGMAHHFQLKKDGFEVKFFLLQSNDGVIRAAFDACDVCFREKKGYSQDGDFMICNNCGMRFHESRINVVKGGCNPSPLARTYDENVVTITVRDIMAGRGYF